MDGVLIDASEWHYEALNRALAIFGCEITRQEHLTVYDGLPTMKKLEILSSSSNLPKRLHGFINELKQKFTMDLTMTKCAPTFNHQYAISKLKKDGYRLAVCSNSIRDTVNTMLSKASLIDYFEFCLSNQDVNKPKPHPEIYLKAIQSFNVMPKECLVLEDNVNGIHAATSAGANVMQINQVSDVNYLNITEMIKKIEKQK